MSLIGFNGRNHPQQLKLRGADVDVDVDDRGTSPEVFGPLDVRFAFDLDVAAAPHNAKCVRFFTVNDDGLNQSWRGARVWCNPPYSDIAPWVEKAWSEHEATQIIVMLLPANRTEQAWWQTMIEPYRDRPGSPLHTEFLPGRLRFLRPGQTAIGPNERPPFGCVLLIWGDAT